jgi:predicted MFS family arabinose efflux permease
MPVAAAQNLFILTGLVFVAGFLCAPTITATLDQVSRLVPEAFRGQAMGWHGSSMTLGAALGAPLTGATIDKWGWGAAFVAVSALGLVVALMGAILMRSATSALGPQT